MTKKKAADPQAPGNAAPARTQRSSAGTPNPAHADASPKQPTHAITTVGIGASAGGLEALEELFQAMPMDTGMAFVVVLHQHRGYKSMLAELLGSKTAMPVSEATDGVALQPNQVYICPPGENLAIFNGQLHLIDHDSSKALHLPIDHFFRSLARDKGERAICIVLSGTGTDGSQGLKAVKGASGMVMVQQPQTAKYAGMPASAIATGLADFILPVDQMPEKLVSYATGPYLTRQITATELPIVPKEPLQKIFMTLRDRTGNDFSSYKANTIGRRIERRMNVHQIQNYDDYVRYLQENPSEVDALFKELLINVTDFFRDREAWDALKPYLDASIKSLAADATLRAWVAGCATGEEAFSLAIALRECLLAAGRHNDVQVFATDLDDESIAKARVGQYPKGIAADLPPGYVERYFTSADGVYRINNDIREMVIFAPQNLIKDPPFTKLDILCCRNLLIYLNSDLQKLVLPIFHYALKPDGLLFLGPSETVGSFGDLFEPLDRRWKIFRRKKVDPLTQQLPPLPRLAPAIAVSKPSSIPTGPSDRKNSVAALIERLLLARFTPSSVVVNQRGDIAYIHGQTGHFLEPAQGEPRNNILEMAREGLKIELATALRECTQKDTEVVRDNVAIKTNGNVVYLDLAVSPLDDSEALRGLFLVTLRPTREAYKIEGEPPASQSRGGSGTRVSQLENELQYLNESYQTIVEQLETSNEELKSTNEELQSTNEELQSTNEELETSKEEMQSLNEELTTVNAELQSKLDELSRANDDMLNLLNSTDIATVFLDRDLTIQRYTEQVKELVMIRQTDIGRPISELAFNLAINDLQADCRQVLNTLVFKEVEVESRDGSKNVYLMRIMPYRTANNVIDGLVLTFINIGKLKHDGAHPERDVDYFESIVDTIRQPLVILNRQFKIVSANKAFYATFDTTPRQTERELIYQLNSGQWDQPRLHSMLEDILSEDAGFEDYRVTIDISKRGRRLFAVNGRRLEQRSGSDTRILLAMEDITPAAGSAAGQS